MAYDVTKDVYPFCGSDTEVDFVLFFTDNKNEPKKINIRRCIEDDTAFTGNALGYSGEDLKDFVMACPKTPTSTIQFDFQFDADRGESNFKNTNGIQFAYQNVYIDGFVSSLSGYSEVAYPDAIERLGNNSISQIEVENICNLSIPRGSQEVARVRILFREGQDNAWQIIDEVSAKVDQANQNFFFDGPNDGTNEDQPLGFYTFYNDRVYPVVPNNISSKNFDNLPKKAEGQAVADNRLMYANYVDGFDPVICRSEGSVVFKDRPKDLVNATLDVSTTFVLNKKAAGGTPRLHGASCAFKIDSSGLPDVVPTGNYNLSINFRAEKNIHLYVAGNKYYGTTLLEREDNGLQFIDPALNDVGGTFIANGMNGFFGQDNAEGPLATDGSRTLSFRGAPIDGAHPGVLSGAWKGKIVGDNDSDTINYVMGSSPANPLIVPFASASINIVFSVDSDNLSNEDLGLNIVRILTGSPQGTPGMSLLSAPGVEELGDSVVLDHNIQTGLEAGDVIKQTSKNSQLVSAIVAKSTSDPRNHPLGFVVLKSGNVKFTFEEVSNQGGVLFFSNQGQPNPQTGSVRFVRMIAQELNLQKEDFLTCMPRPVKGRGHVRRNTDIFTNSPAISDSRDTLWGLSRLGISGNVQARVVWPTIALDIGQGQVNPPFIRPKNQVAIQISAIPSIGDGGATFPAGLGVTNFSSGFRAVIPAPIDEWLLFDQAGINNDDANTGTRVRDYYSINIPGLSNQETEEFAADIGGNATFPFSNSNLFLLLPSGPSELGSFPPTFSSCWEGYVDSLAPAVGIAPDGATNGPSHLVEAISVVDGAAGPGGAGIDGAEDDEKFRFDLGDLYKVCQIGDTARNQLTFSGPQVPCANRYGSVWSSTLVGLVDNLPYLTFKGEYLRSGDTIPAYSKYQDAASTTPLTPRTIGFEDLKSAPLNSLGSILQSGITGTSIGSFKTRDTHDFGLVYYDKRGRASTVFPIQSVYVPGYSDGERDAPGATKGPVSIRQRLLHEPPEWAERYKIVYSPASKISRFIQYSAGGAFINENQPSGAEDKIYVSLNYLQRKSISYSDAYGARDQDTGETTLYRFTPGDRLRVLSYYESEDARVWADDVAVFDVVGQEEFLKDQDEHPFLDEADVTENLNAATQNPILRRTGSFVVLRNNKDANGFTALDIRNGTDKWGNRCVFEITSYKNDLSDELQAYYETAYGGTVDFNPNAGKHQHSNTNIVIEYGDVFFRGVPVNFQFFNSATNEFEDLIEFDGDLQGASSQSNFLNYYLESESVTDLYRSQTKGYGKIHFYNPDAEERRHEASITFSEKTDVQSGNLFYAFFSPIQLNFFDLDIDYGAINYIASIGNELVSMQESKCSLLQVAKSMTTRADGTDDLISSNQILSSPRYFVDEIGTGGNPESVVVANDTVYFADRNNFAVAAISPTGSMKILSDQGMSDFFEKRFLSLNTNELNLSQLRNKGIRVIGGYDPLNKQFLITIKQPPSGNPDIDDSDFSSIAPELTSTQGVPAIPFISIGASSTIAYDVAGESGWLTRYSFVPTCYGFVGKDFVSFRLSSDDDANPNVIYSHNKDVSSVSKFYGKAFVSFFRAVFNVDLYKSKNFNTISIEPSQRSSVGCRLRTKNEVSDIKRWNVYEDTEYAEIGRSLNQGPSVFTTAGQVSKIEVQKAREAFTDSSGNIVNQNFDTAGGEVLSVDISFENNISQIAFNLNSFERSFDPKAVISEAVVFDEDTTRFKDALGYSGLYLLPHRVIDQNTMRFIARNNGVDFDLPFFQDFQQDENTTVFQAYIESLRTTLNNKVLVIRSTPRIYGDKLRDKFAILDFVYNGNFASTLNLEKQYKLEVDAVSVDVTESEFT